MKVARLIRILSSKMRRGWYGRMIEEGKGDRVGREDSEMDAVAKCGS